MLSGCATLREKTTVPPLFKGNCPVQEGIKIAASKADGSLVGVCSSGLSFACSNTVVHQDIFFLSYGGPSSQTPSHRAVSNLQGTLLHHLGVHTLRLTSSVSLQPTISCVILEKVASAVFGFTILRRAFYARNLTNF